MGIVHRGASLSPTKQEIVEGWLPTRGWAQGRTVAEKVGEYRLDDPAGEVGVETIVWRADDGALLQTPLTYRSEPLASAEEHLVATTEHSVLGTRWVYDGCGDPVWADTLVRAILTGGHETPMFFERDGERVDIPPRIEVSGSGSADASAPVTTVDGVRDEDAVTVVEAGGHTIALARVVGTPLGEGPQLTGTVAGEPDVHVWAALRDS
ncbi:maltokinase N-terminal cap-like domain-containing protein [Nocardioides zeicaulis]|uniref:Maltokinase N-terminal cap domain-containing protein n=1 Tax=Nocardioides zeicaulis TaxID=1776857 RepID=A0ABV6E6I0_9ACTN